MVHHLIGYLSHPSDYSLNYNCGFSQ
uniref:Uncharacterized protein n=1 Tax=Rhizophora mucronata TaxID=61149 RepID=A0A2P2NMV1_RHIMU